MRYLSISLIYLFNYLLWDIIWSLFGLFQLWPFGTLNWLMCPFDLIVHLGECTFFLPFFFFDISRCFRLIFYATEPSQFSKVATNVSLPPAILLYLGIIIPGKEILSVSVWMNWRFILQPHFSVAYKKIHWFFSLPHLPLLI